MLGAGERCDVLAGREQAIGTSGGISFWLRSSVIFPLVIPAVDRIT